MPIYGKYIRVDVGQAQGDLAYYSGSSWVRLPPSTSGLVLKTQGAGANPIWGAVSGTGDVVGPSSATDNGLARFDTTTGKLIQNSTVTVDDNGNLFLNVDGSTAAAPRVFGATNFSGVEAIRWEFGDVANAIQNIYGGSMTLYAYHTVVLRGGRHTAALPGFDWQSNIGTWVVNTDAANTALVVDGAAGQTADLQQWRTSAATLLTSVDASGNIVFAGTQTVDGVDVSGHSARHNPGGADALATAAPVTTAVQIGNAAAAGTATSVSRSDHQHTVTAGTPVNVTKAANADGTATTFARSDHKHDITTAAASAVGTSNTEGSSTSLARADHGHQVSGLTISGQAQGDIIYFNGTSWVRLAAGTSGQALKTQGTGANPVWGSSGAGGFALFSPALVNTGAIDVYQNGATWGGLFIATEDTTISSLICLVYQAGGAGNVTGGVYRCSDGARIGLTDNVSAATTGYKYLTLSAGVALTKGAAYYLAIACTSNGSRFCGNSGGFSGFNLSPKPAWTLNSSALPATLTGESGAANCIWIQANV